MHEIQHANLFKVTVPGVYGSMKDVRGSSNSTNLKVTCSSIDCSFVKKCCHDKLFENHFPVLISPKMKVYDYQIIKKKEFERK